MTKQEKIREWIAIKLSIYALEAAWSLLSPFRKQVYLDQAFAIMEYQNSQGVVIKVERELPNDCIYRSPKQEEAYCAGRDTVLKAGYVATIPLVEESKQ